MYNIGSGIRRVCMDNQVTVISWEIKGPMGTEVGGGMGEGEVLKPLAKFQFATLIALFLNKISCQRNATCMFTRRSATSLRYISLYIHYSCWRFRPFPYAKIGFGGHLYNIVHYSLMLCILFSSGGAPESLLARPGDVVLILKPRMGFLKIALTKG